MKTVSYEDLPSIAGQETGVSEWVLIDQDRINKFAACTGDHQWIHVDRERAAAGPFGRTIAHGYLTLSLVIPLLNELLDVKGVSMGINYGLNKVRFPAPVPVGAKVRLAAQLGAVPGRKVLRRGLEVVPHHQHADLAQRIGQQVELVFLHAEVFRHRGTRRCG